MRISLIILVMVKIHLFKNPLFLLNFVSFSVLFFLFQWWFQTDVLGEGSITSATVRAAAFSGVMFLSFALTASLLFKWYPRWAQYWYVRRALGVTGFLFVLVHAWLVLDEGLHWQFGLIFAEPNPFINPIIFGMVALMLLTIVALVSADFAVARLGRKWKTIQRLVYPMYLLIVAHYLFVNPAALRNLMGQLLLLQTGFLLGGQLYWWWRTVQPKHFRTRGTWVGVLLMLGYGIVFLLGYLVFQYPLPFFFTSP